MRYIMAVMIAMLALGSVASAATVNSTLNFNAVGHVSNDITSIDSSCNYTNAVMTSSVGMADVQYSNSVLGNSLSNTIISNGGNMRTSTGMMTMAWTLPTTSCNNDGICTSTPGSYTLVTAQSDVLLTGVGGVATSTAPNTFNMDAVGTGTLSRSISVIDMNGNVNKTSCINDYRYNERTRIGGTFDLSSRFSI